MPSLPPWAVQVLQVLTVLLFAPLVSGAIARAEARRMFHSAPGMLSPFVVRLFEKVLALQ